MTSSLANQRANYLHTKIETLQKQTTANKKAKWIRFSKQKPWTEKPKRKYKKVGEKNKKILFHNKGSFILTRIKWTPS